MTAPDYTKWLAKKGKKNRKTSAGEEQDGNAAKRPRPDQAAEVNEASASRHVIEVESTPNSPVAGAVAVQSPPPRGTPTVQEGGAFLSLEAGELWKTGVSDRLRAVIRPPPLLMGGSSLTPEMKGMLGRLEESSLKTTSLVQAFHDLALQLDDSKASNASLAAANEALNKSKADLEGLLETASATQKKLGEDLTAAKEALSTEKIKSEQLLTEKDVTIKRLSEEKEGVELKLKETEDELKQANDDYEEARLFVVKGVEQAWDNAIAQAPVLNPNLITEGMDIGCKVKDGFIHPSTPGGDEVEENQAP